MLARSCALPHPKPLHHRQRIILTLSPFDGLVELRHNSAPWVCTHFVPVLVTSRAHGVVVFNYCASAFVPNSVSAFVAFPESSAQVTNVSCDLLGSEPKRKEEGLWFEKRRKPEAAKIVDY